MKPVLTALVAALALCAASVAQAAPVKLKPASPQPAGLKQGLAVEYAFPPEVKTLGEAQRALKRAKKGTPLKGLDYRDTLEGEPTLTSGQPLRVAAGISGYMKFDAPGTYVIDFLVNDGIQMKLGGKEIMFWEERTPCEPTDAVEVSVPEAGWYELEAVYFQRLGTACLHMRSGPKGGKVTWTPNASFAYK